MERTTTIYSICTEKVYLHATSTESIMGVKDNLGKPVSKFKRWGREVILSVIVLTELGINGLKVYLGIIGVCTKNLVSEIGCCAVDCPFLHEIRDYITLMIKDYCSKYALNNTSETME
jgi:hypothetical protein